MLVVFICVYVVLAVLVFLMFRVLKKSVTRIGEQSKTYYIDKLSEYDDLINDKEKKLNILNEEIKNKKVEIESIKNDFVNKEVDFDISIIDVLSRAKYQDKSIFEIENMIRENFDYNPVSIINEFINKVDSTKNYDFCKKLRRKFTPKKIYNLKLLQSYELEITLKMMLDDKEWGILEFYKDTNNEFTIDGFLNFIDELVDANNPKIIVYVGNKNENYDYLNKNIKTIVDKNIYRGIKILYQSRMYDFSLNGRNL